MSAPIKLMRSIPQTAGAGGGTGGSVAALNPTDVFGLTWLGYTLTGFAFTVPAPGTLAYTIGAGTAMIDGNFVSAPSFSASSLANNTIYDLWLDNGGNWLVEAYPDTNYGTAPLHTNMLHIVRVQTDTSPYSGTPSVTGIFKMANSWPQEIVTQEQSLDLIDFVQDFFWIPNNVATWTATTAYDVGDLYKTPAGKRIYKVEIAGTSGATEPTATYGSFANEYFVQDGTTGTACFSSFFGIESFQGSFRWGKNNGVEQYFQNLGLALVCSKLTAYPNPTDGVVTDMILSHIKKCFYTVCHVRQSSFAYGAGQYIIAAGFYWIVTTAGTTSGTSTFTGSYSVGSTVTDGGVSFRAVYGYYTSGSPAVDWVWLDILQDFATYKYPDSHDSYASTLATLINTYIDATGNTSWLSTTSPQAGLTYYAVLQNIINYNLNNQMYSGPVSLTNTFQNQVAPWAPSTFYPISYLEDNAESYQGLMAAASIAQLMGDTTSESAWAVTAANVAGQMLASFYGTSSQGNSFFTYYYPQDTGYNWTTVDAYPTGSLQYYPNLEPNLWPELCGLPYVNSVFYNARNWVVSKWPSYWGDSSKDAGFPDLHIGVLAVSKWKKPEIAMAAKRIADTFTVPQNVGGNLTIDEFGRYLFIQDQLIVGSAPAPQAVNELVPGAIVNAQSVVLAPVLSGYNESAAIYCKPNITGIGDNRYAILLEVPNTQVDTSGGAIKVNHYGGGDGIYVAAFATGSTSVESASYVDGTKGFISTVQSYTPFYTTLFNALWGNASVPGYGMYLADQAPGMAFTAKQFAGITDSNVPMFAVVNSSLVYLGGIDTFGNFLSGTANPAVSGKVRLANTDAIKFRNAANSADLSLGVSAGNLLTFGGVSVAPTVSPALTGTPTAPTQAALNNSTRLSTTAYTDLAVGVEKTRALAAEAAITAAGSAWTIVSKSANYTAHGYEQVMVSTTGGSVTITLPSVAGGKPVQVTKITSDANLVTVTPASGNIDSLSSLSISQQGESIDTMPDGTNWWLT